MNGTTTILPRHAGTRATLGLFSALWMTGCSTFLAVHEQQERADQNAIVSGSVTIERESRGPLVVGLLAKSDSDVQLVDHFIAEKPGPWVFAVQAGTYWLAAFEDINRNGRYDDEPALRADLGAPLVLQAGQHVDSIDLRIPETGRFQRRDFALSDLVARSADEQQHTSLFALSVAGEVSSLDNPRFSREIATKGMWKFYDFLLETRPGIYLLEPYDPAKIPVLFIHGMDGTPRDFETIVERLDHKRFQPWVFYYPSGQGLEGVSALLTQLFVRLRVQYGFDRAAVVAHSMGGLVSREFILSDYETNGTNVVRTYVTISSPLDGMTSAGRGVEDSPVVVRSWYGLAPGSPFLDGLFYRDPMTKKVRRTLPNHVAYHMLFGFLGGGRSGSSDGTVALESQLRSEAQQEARSERGFNQNHTGILKSPAAVERLNEILGDLR